MFAGPKFMYSQRCLLTLRSAVLSVLCDDDTTHIHMLGLRRRRHDCRSGLTVHAYRPSPALLPAGSGTYTVLTERRLSPWRRRVHGSYPLNLTDRHSAAYDVHWPLCRIWQPQRTLAVTAETQLAAREVTRQSTERSTTEQDMARRRLHCHPSSTQPWLPGH